ncbi:MULTISPECIES: carboxylating nicotinate-nucleotide diphosphorylase [unclassified Gordonia (in: high G+C Gram-positive bacteria)]|uniref:carboxylating nicotinate-nucleotide diphosphorylase n=1 Tax=Gordonia TaxID=2053 RepID=UPI001B82D25E|nr:MULTISPECIES: carboxylating nicotinate-nucleotide diphosphorylase [unclassified Gordonia (in: high G+C Gram-positive bacteria)]MBR7192725.1 carboxylating nicotinate-nucleotide diphosphorylase [Gordonia sp. SCSIO 19800]MDT0219430.1 carboxylating nicotinate-nucleotide diphosphorylase [Gordonia sp. AC31]
MSNPAPSTTSPGDGFVGQAAGGELGAAVTDEVRALIRTALDEDLRYGPDVTTASTVPADAVVDAAIVSRAHGVIAGVPVVEAVFDEVIGAGEYTITSRVDDGTRVEPGAVVLAVHAPTRALLTAERTALNLISHLSGIATTTAAWVAAVEGTDARIRDSRKTLPGLRHLQKYAVRAGGGVNHRMGLGDAALIKDNHVVAAGSVAAALEAVRAAAPGLPVEVEVDSLAQLDEVLGLEPQLVLLDNFEPWETQMAVQRRNTRSPGTKLESSGGLSLDVAADYARTGVDYLAVGALTHSVTVLDLGLDIPAP